jgi:hypothetical protein
MLLSYKCIIFRDGGNIVAKTARQQLQALDRQIKKNPNTGKRKSLLNYIIRLQCYNTF